VDKLLFASASESDDGPLDDEAQTLLDDQAAAVVEVVKCRMSPQPCSSAAFAALPQCE
jgi:hypothetical protein